MATDKRAAKTIVFSDVDGTLLNSKHGLTPKTREAIMCLQRKGIPFVIMTARGITGTYPMLEQNELTCFVVTYSGGVILDPARRIIHHHGFSKAQAEEVVSFMMERSFDAAWCAYSFEDWVVADKTDPRVQNEERIVMAEAREGTIASLSRDEVQKLLLICNPAQTVQIEHELRERFGHLSIARSSDILIEVMPANTSKAHAVKLLCEMLQIDSRNAIAFGDSYNDMPMLEAVGEGYLMANAPQELLEKFDRHTLDNDHDGIYEALRMRGLVDDTR